MNRRPSQSRSGYDSFSPQHTAHFRADQPDGDFFDPKPPKSLRRRVLLILLALILAILLINVAVNQFVRVERVTVPIRKMDAAFEGYTLLHISDLKGLLFGKDQQFIRFALRDAQFDAVVMTGDMVSSRGNAQPLYELIEVLRELNPDAPIYMIPGDRDPLPASMSYATGGSPLRAVDSRRTAARRTAAQLAPAHRARRSRALADDQCPAQSRFGYHAGAI